MQTNETMKPRPKEIKKLSQSLKADTRQSCDLNSGPSDTWLECIELRGAQRTALFE